MPSSSILIIEDSPAQALTYAAFLDADTYHVTIAGTAAEARARIQLPPALILLDLHLPDGSGLELLREFRAQGMVIPVIVVTAETSLDIAVAAIHAGVRDFISKPVTRERLNLIVRNILERQSLKNMLETGRPADHDNFFGFCGNSPAMQAAYRMLENAAQSRAPVLITGESGTGKELAAHALHRLGPRRDAHFEAINCAAIPAALIESEIFGHAKGAFTGATASYIGAAQRSDKGTLFLDELTEMPQELQPKLLRFTQTGAFRPIGGNTEHKTDVRFIAATNRDPQAAIGDGKLREDLYYRLNVIHIHLPPLRERGNDTLLIADSLLRKITQEEKKSFRALHDDVKDLLLSYNWPGNVRQLENTLRRAIVLHDAETLTLRMIPPFEEKITAPATIAAEITPLKDVERQTIERAVRICGGNISEAARRLEINPSTIHRKLTQWRD